MNAIDRIIVWYVKQKIKEIRKMSDGETKPIWQSKTVISSFVAMIIGILGAFGVGGIAGESESITQTAMLIVQAVASAFAIYGRIKAEKKLK